MHLIDKWVFATTPVVETMLTETILEAVRLFSISEQEVVDRINLVYHGIAELTEDYLYLDDPRGLAHYVCCGDYWWLSKAPLVIKPYPEPPPLGRQIDWSFTTDADSDSFLREIVMEVVRRFHVCTDDAVCRVNGLRINWDKIVGSHIIYHELPDYWACDIYFGHNTHWWLTTPSLDLAQVNTVMSTPPPKAVACRTYQDQLLILFRSPDARIAMQHLDEIIQSERYRRKEETPDSLLYSRGIAIGRLELRVAVERDIDLTLLKVSEIPAMETEEPDRVPKLRKEFARLVDGILSRFSAHPGLQAVRPDEMGRFASRIYD